MIETIEATIETIASQTVSWKPHKAQTYIVYLEPKMGPLVLIGMDHMQYRLVGVQYRGRNLRCVCSVMFFRQTLHHLTPPSPSFAPLFAVTPPFLG